MKQKVVILGITGCLGKQIVNACQVLHYQIVGCSYHTNKISAKKIIQQNKIKYVFCSHYKNNENCHSFNNLIKKAKPTLIINAIVGFAGLKGSIASLKNKITLILANKESIVVAGNLLFLLAKTYKTKIIPLDSEHTNLYYLLKNVDCNNINQIYITCSGGKFFNKPKNELKKITYYEAIKHNNWIMGEKITIDSNTLINKCFEIVEAYWYFKTKRINILLDRTSTTHCAILLNNGKFICSYSCPTMFNSIILALTNLIDVKVSKKIIFEKRYEPTILYKMNNFLPIKWAFKIINDKSCSLGIIINAANDAAIDLFKQKKITFDQIIIFIKNAIKKIKYKQINNFQDIIAFNNSLRKNFVNYHNFLK